MIELREVETILRDYLLLLNNSAITVVNVDIKYVEDVISKHYDIIIDCSGYKSVLRGAISNVGDYHGYDIVSKIE